MSILGGDKFKESMEAFFKKLQSRQAVERVLSEEGEGLLQKRPVASKYSTSRRITRATALAAATGMVYFVPKYVAQSLKSVGVTPPKSMLSTVKFYTDFTENDPLKYWSAWGNAGLALEPFENHMTALPNGPCVVQPSAQMSDGQASFQFLAGSPAEFIVRGQNRDNCYSLRMERHKFKDNTSYFTFQVKQIFKGKTRNLSSAIFQDLDYTRLELQRLVVNMEGKEFVAYLEREIGSGDLFGGRVDRKVLHTWRADLYSNGHVGMTGSANPDPVAKNKFRVFAVRLES
jgi:hypothetical protein